MSTPDELLGAIKGAQNVLKTQEADLSGPTQPSHTAPAPANSADELLDSIKGARASIEMQNKDVVLSPPQDPNSAVDDDLVNDIKKAQNKVKEQEKAASNPSKHMVDQIPSAAAAVDDDRINDDSSVISAMTTDFPMSPKPAKNRTISVNTKDGGGNGAQIRTPDDVNSCIGEGGVVIEDGSVLSGSQTSSQLVKFSDLPDVGGGDDNDVGDCEGGASQALSVEDGSLEVTSIEGSITLGSDSVGKMAEKKSRKRAGPSDPSQFNAVTVKLVNASGIRKWDASCDPFALVTVGKTKTSFSEKLDYLDETGYHDSLHETDALENTTEPEWNETTTIIFPPGEYKKELHIQVQDKDMGKGDDLGEIRLKLTKFISDDPENPTECELPLEGDGAGDAEPTILILVNFANVDDTSAFEGDESSFTGSLTYMDSVSTIAGGDGHPIDKKELLHCGDWIPQVFDVGRLKPWTGLYTCCGSQQHFSMYCPSIGARVEFAHKWKKQKDYEHEAPIRRAAAKKKYDDWLADKNRSIEEEKIREESIKDNDGEEPLSEIEIKHFFMSKEWKKKKGIWREPKMNDSETAGVNENDLFELRMRRVKPSDLSMVVSTMRKNPDNHWMVDQGLEILNRLLDIPDAQKKCLNFGALSVVLNCVSFHTDDYNLQLKGMIVLRKHCQESTLTRLTEKAMLNMDVTKVAISNLKNFRSKEEMVVNCLEVLRVTSTYRKNRTQIFECGTITHVTLCLVGYRNNVDVICPAFLLLETLGSMNRGRKEILEKELVKIALSIMTQYEDNQRVLAASMGMLLLACEDEEGLKQMLRSNGVSVTLYAMKHLVNQAELQQRGLEFMKKLSLTKKGAAILDSIKGSWQWLAQGTVSGNALIHLLDGPLQSKGWAMGDINEADTLNKGVLFNSSAQASGARGEALAQWTASGLKKYMGLSQKEKTLKVSTEEGDFYFNTVRDLGLLPRKNERREAWFQRVKRFEERNGIDIKELVERNQARVFGGEMPEDRPYSEEEDSEDEEGGGEGEEGGEEGEAEKEKKRKALMAKKQDWTKHGGGGPMVYKETKRKAAKGRKDRNEVVEVVEKVYEKRPVFLEGHYSAGWTRKKGENHGKFKPEGSGSSSSKGGHGGSEGNERTWEGSGGDNEDNADVKEDGEDDDDGSGDDDDDGSSFANSSVVSFSSSTAKKEKAIQSLKSTSFQNIKRTPTRAKFEKIIAERPPEKRREVFKTREHMDLWIPAPLEHAYPEVIGTHMETASHVLAEKQYSFYEDPLTFGRTKEEVDAMRALEDMY